MALQWHDRLCEKFSVNSPIWFPKGTFHLTTVTFSLINNPTNLMWFTWTSEKPLIQLPTMSSYANFGILESLAVCGNGF